MNPHWHDLAERWGDVYKPDLAGVSREIPFGFAQGRLSPPLVKARGLGMTPLGRIPAFRITLKATEACRQVLPRECAGAYNPASSKFQ
jgi:hypothetical protein